MKILVDTDVMFDTLTKREPFYKDSAIVWSWASEGLVEGYISAISVNNIFYIVRKLNGLEYAQRLVDRILEDFEIISLTKDILKQARTIDSGDYEDLIQYFSALHEGCEIIVTRNKRDFPQIGLKLMTPKEFIDYFTNEIS